MQTLPLFTVYYHDQIFTQYQYTLLVMANFLKKMLDRFDHDIRTPNKINRWNANGANIYNLLAIGVH